MIGTFTTALALLGVFEHPLSRHRGHLPKLLFLLGIGIGLVVCGVMIWQHTDDPGLVDCEGGSNYGPWILAIGAVILGLFAIILIYQLIHHGRVTAQKTSQARKQSSHEIQLTEAKQKEAAETQQAKVEALVAAREARAQAKIDAAEQKKEQKVEADAAKKEKAAEKAAQKAEVAADKAQKKAQRDHQMKIAVEDARLAREDAREVARAKKEADVAAQSLKREQLEASRQENQFKAMKAQAERVDTWGDTDYPASKYSGTPTPAGFHRVKPHSAFSMTSPKKRRKAKKKRKSRRKN